jgi:large subunit ribosomal protein L29
VKITEIRNMTIDQLKDTIVTLKKEAFNLRFQKVTGELTNTARVREIRRLVARMKTIVNEKNLVGEGNA